VIGDNIHLWLVNAHSGKYLNVHHGIDADGTNVYQWSDDGTIDQIFKAVWSSATGAYTIRAMCSDEANSRVLHVAGASVAEGSNVEICLPGPSDRQLWQIEPVGDGIYRILTCGTDFALTSFGTEENTTNGQTPTTPGNVFISEYIGAPSQHWQLRLNPYGNLNWAYMYEHVELFNNISSGYKVDTRPDHYGFDIIGHGCPESTGMQKIYGEPVRSVCHGRVEDVGNDASRGFYIVIECDDYDPLDSNKRLWIRYLHLLHDVASGKVIEVSNNDRVYPGQVIGYTGNTGSVWPVPTPEKPWNGTHLHLDVNTMMRTGGPWPPDYLEHFRNPQKFFPQIKFVGDTSSKD